MAWPVPPFGEFYVAQGLPFALHPTGVLTATAHCFHAEGRPLQPVAFRPWTELASVSAQAEHLVIDSSRFWSCDNPAQAVHLAALLRAGAKLRDSEREAWISETVAAGFNLTLARSRLTETRNALAPLRIAAIILWSLLFVVIPIAVWIWNWDPTLWWAIPSAYLLSFWIARSANTLHREWYPDAADERFRLALLTALSPVTAIRATDLLSRARFAEFHPATVALAALSRETAARFCAGLWRDQLHPRRPLPHLPTPSGSAVLDSWTELQRIAFQAMAVSEGFKPEDWTHPPPPTDPAHTLHCPRCQSQATASAHSCQECGGLPLVPLTTPLTTRAAASAGS